VTQPPALILIAEDERKIARVLADYLEAAGMRTVRVADGAEVLGTVSRAAPDLVLLDLMLPNLDGYAICRELRREGALPIIMLTAKVEEIDRLLGLELGADDYVCKPFSPREVVARVKAVLRRSAAPIDPGAALIDVDRERQRASVAGQRLDLTPIEFKLLATLTRHPGRVYRRDELLDLIYDDFREVSDRTVDSHVKNLRRKLEHALPNQRVIHSVYGIGYRYETE
jgi:two-component system, OmpR family, response regulator BaeR